MPTYFFSSLGRSLPAPLYAVAGVVFATVMALALAGCDKSGGSAYSPRFTTTPSTGNSAYVFGVHPLHNPQHLQKIFGPMTDYLSARSGVAIQLEASRDYASFDEKLYARHFHFALPNPYQTINALQKGYRVFGKMGDDENFRGIILVRRDGGIENVADLKGKAMSSPARTALAATMMPLYYLHTHGIDVKKDIEVRYVGSQESSIMNAYLGNVAAAATWPPPWRALAKERPELGRALKIAWQTDTLPNNSLMARDDVPPEVVGRIAELLFTMHNDKEGRAILEGMALTRFEAANESTYKPVRAFVARFRQSVGEPP